MTIPTTTAPRYLYAGLWHQPTCVIRDGWNCSCAPLPFDGEPVPYGGAWHSPDCDTVKTGQIGSVEYGQGDAPCSCDTTIALAAARDQGLAPTFGQLLREFGRFVDDHDLPAPLSIEPDGTTGALFVVDVRGADFGPWFQHFHEGLVITVRGPVKDMRAYGDLGQTLTIELRATGDPAVAGWNPPLVEALS